MPSPSLDVAPSWRLTAFPRLHRQDASNPLLQPTFRVTSTRLLRSVVSGDSLPGAVGKPAGVRLRGRSGRGVATLHPGTAPDHLAVIRPPAASCLTARCRLRAVRSPRSCGARVEELGSLVSSRKLRRNRPSDTSRGAWKGTRSARFSSRVAPFQPAHVNVADLVRSRGAFRRAGPTWAALASGPGGALLRWPAELSPHVFIDVREHRLDPRSPAVRDAPEGRVRLYDFCR